MRKQGFENFKKKLYNILQNIKHSVTKYILQELACLYVAIVDNTET